MNMNFFSNLNINIKNQRGVHFEKVIRKSIISGSRLFNRNLFGYFLLNIEYSVKLSVDILSEMRKSI